MEQCVFMSSWNVLQIFLTTSSPAPHQCSHNWFQHSCSVFDCPSKWLENILLMVVTMVAAAMWQLFLDTQMLVKHLFHCIGICKSVCWNIFEKQSCLLCCFLGPITTILWSLVKECAKILKCLCPCFNAAKQAFSSPETWMAVIWVVMPWQLCTTKNRVQQSQPALPKNLTWMTLN